MRSEALTYQIESTGILSAKDKSVKQFSNGENEAYWPKR